MNKVFYPSTLSVRYRTLCVRSRYAYITYNEIRHIACVLQTPRFGSLIARQSIGKWDKKSDEHIKQSRNSAANCNGRKLLPHFYIPTYAASVSVLPFIYSVFID